MKTNTVFKSEEGKKLILAQYRSLLDHFPVPHREKMIDTPFGKTYLLECGNMDRPAIFLFHGSCSNSAMWLGDMATLSERYHVFSADIPGEAGNSDENRLNTASAEYADWIRALLDAVGIRQAIFMGNSFGGWVALKFDAVYPDRVSKLVLIASAGITPTKLSFIFKSVLYLSQGEKGLRSLNKMIFGADEIPEEAVTFSNLIVSHFNPMTGALPEYTDAQLKRLTMPVLYLAGENDVTVDAAKSARRIKELIPQATVCLIKNNGHVVYHTMNCVLPFLESEV